MTRKDWVIHLNKQSKREKTTVVDALEATYKLKNLLFLLKLSKRRYDDPSKADQTSIKRFGRT